MPVRVDGKIESAEELLSQVKHLATLVDSFFEEPLPDACEALIYRCDLANQNHTYLSGFERYAARALRSVQAERLRPIFSRHQIGVGRLGATGLCWLSFDPDLLKPEEQQIVLDVESVINRLVLMTKQVGDATGVAALSADNGEGYCMQQDWDLFRFFGNEIDAFMGQMPAENPLANVFGVQAPKGGEWDTRTRFARYMESIVAPYRLDYRFDCEVRRGVLECHVSTLAPAALPHQRWDGVLHQWTNSSEEGNRLALAYALRLCSFVAGAAFFSNIAITDVVVTAHQGLLSGKPVTSLYFQRMPYLMHVVPAMKMGELSDAETVFDPLATARILNPSEYRFGIDEEGLACVVEPLRIDFSERRVPTWKDERAIPAQLCGLLHASQVRDLDVSRIEDERVMASVREAALDVDEFPMASMATFEEMLDANEEAISGNALFCVDENARVLMGLADPSENTYEKYPDALYVAKQKLATINKNLGDLEAALVMAQECVELAPSSPAAYLDAATIYLQMDRPEDARRMLEMALCFAVDRSTIVYAYYRLAYACWLCGQVDESLALYTLVANAGANFATQAAEERAQVQLRAGRLEVPSMEEVGRIMEDADIPVAPTREVWRTLAKAVIGLVEEEVFVFTWPIVLQMAQRLDRDVMVAVVASLRDGVEDLG